MFGAEFGEEDATGQSDLVNTVLTNVLRTLTPTVGAANVENIPFRGRHGNLPLCTKPAAILLLFKHLTRLHVHSLKKVSN